MFILCLKVNPGVLSVRPWALVTQGQLVALAFLLSPSSEALWEGAASWAVLIFIHLHSAKWTPEDYGAKLLRQYRQNLVELLTDTQTLLQGISAAQSLAPTEREVSSLLHVCEQILSFNPHLGSLSSPEDLIYYFLWLGLGQSSSRTQFNDFSVSHCGSEAGNIYEAEGWQARVSDLGTEERCSALERLEEIADVFVWRAGLPSGHHLSCSVSQVFSRVGAREGWVWGELQSC